MGRARLITAASFTGSLGWGTILPVPVRLRRRRPPLGQHRRDAHRHPVLPRRRRRCTARGPPRRPVLRRAGRRRGLAAGGRGHPRHGAGRQRPARSSPGCWSSAPRSPQPRLRPRCSCSSPCPPPGGARSSRTSSRAWRSAWRSAPSPRAWSWTSTPPSGMWPAFAAATLGFVVTAAFLAAATRSKSLHDPDRASSSRRRARLDARDGDGWQTYRYLLEEPPVRLLGLLSIALAAGFYAQFETGLPAFALQSLSVEPERGRHRGGGELRRHRRPAVAGRAAHRRPRRRGSAGRGRSDLGRQLAAAGGGAVRVAAASRARCSSSPSRSSRSARRCTPRSSAR